MKALLYIFSALFIVSCTEDTVTESAEMPTREKLLNGRFDAYENTVHCNCDEIVQDSTNTYFKNDTIFTGVCFNTYPDTDLKMEEKQIFEGKIHGFYRVYSKEGDTLTETLYLNGALNIEKDLTPSTCLCSELETKSKSNDKDIPLKTYNGIPYTGTCKEYYPGLDSTQIYMEIPYLKGLAEGKMIIYDKDNTPIMMQRFEKGVEKQEVTFSNQ